MVRVGEMMVIIRAQDFASRTLHRVSGEMAAMQRQQASVAKSQRKHLPALRQQAKLIEELGIAQSKFNRIAGASKTPGWTTFGRSAAGRAQLAQINKLRTELTALQKTIPAALHGIHQTSAAFDAWDASTSKTLADRLHRIGTAMSGIGRTMQLFGAVGTGAFALMANSFANFSQSAATTGTQMRDLGAPMKQAVDRSKELQAAIIDMSMVFPNSAQDMTEAAYEIFSSMNLMKNGVMDVQTGLQLLAVANKAAVAGQVDLGEATNAMIVALNIFDPQLRDVKGTMDEVFNIVRFGKIHLDDLSKHFTQFASAAHAGGISLKEIGAAFATLTLFNPPNIASAGLGRLVELLRTPQFRKGFKNMLNIDIIAPDTGKMKPILQIFEEIVKARPDLAASRQAAIDFFMQLTRASGMTKIGIQGTVQARRAFETFATHMETFRDVVANVRVNYDEMNKAFESRMADPGVQWELFKNRLKALVLVIGKEALPVFLRIGESIANIVQWFRRMNDGMRGTIIRWAAWLSVGVLVAGVVLSMIGGILQLVATFRLLSIASKLAGISMASSMAMAGGWAVLALAAGVAAIMVIRHWDKVRAFFYAFMESLKADWGNTMQHMAGLTLKGVAAIINPLYQLEKRVPFAGKFMKFLGPLNLATAGLEAAGDSLMNSSEGFNSFWDRYRRIVKEFGKGGPGANMDWLKDFKRIAGDFDGRMLSEEYKKWADSVGKNTGEAAKLAKEHANAVKQATENMENTIKTAANNLMQTYEQLQQANRDALGGLFQGPTMQGIMGNIFSSLNDNLRQFGVQIPVPFAILRQDLEQSVTYFKRWRTAINNLVKRGLPHEMVSEIMAMGPAQGLSIAEGLLQAPKGAFKSIIATYRKGQALTDKATKEDMARKLKFWESFGKDAAFATIMGIINNPRNAQIQKMYEDYVRDTYGSILQKTFQEDVAEYMANAIANAKAQAEQANIFGAMPPLFAGKKLSPQQIAAQRAGLTNLTPAQLTRQYKASAQMVENWTKTARGEHNQLTPMQQAAIERQRRRMRLIRQEYARDAAPSVRRQLAKARREGRTGQIKITYAGDTVTIRADGATVQSVTRALQKQHFAKNHKHKKGTAAGLYTGPH